VGWTRQNNSTTKHDSRFYRRHQQREITTVTDNPLLGTATRCFACGPDNPIGLKIAFSLDDGVCTGAFTPGEFHVGFNDTVMANLLYLQGIKAFTARCEIRYRRALRVGETVTLSSRVDSERRRLVNLVGEARLAGSGELVADAKAAFMLE
jgi:hypothetical protein